MKKAVYHNRYGRGTVIAEDGDRWTVHFTDIDQTKKIVRRFLSLQPKVDNRADLEEQLKTAKDDDPAWMVYADLLQQEGDVRGELIMLEQRSSERSDNRTLEDEIAQKITANTTAWLGDWLDRLSSKDEIDCEWKRGFLLSVHIKERPVRALGALMSRSAARFVRRVKLSRVEDNKALAQVLELLEEAALEQLDLELDALSDTGVSTLLETKHLSALRSLRVEWNMVTPEAKQRLLKDERLDETLRKRLEKKL